MRFYVTVLYLVLYYLFWRKSPLIGRAEKNVHSFLSLLLLLKIFLFFSQNAQLKFCPVYCMLSMHLKRIPFSEQLHLVRIRPKYDQSQRPTGNMIGVSPMLFSHLTNKPLERAKPCGLVLCRTERSGKNRPSENGTGLKNPF